MTSSTPDPLPPIQARPGRRGLSRRLVLVLISVATVIWLPASLAALTMAMFSVFLFDAPGSTEQLGTVTLALSVIAFAPTCWLAIALSWLMIAFRWCVASLACMALPLIPLAVGAIAWIWIEVVQHGSFGS